MDFGAFLESRADFQHRKDVCYHKIQTILSLPKHPNIIALSPSERLAKTNKPLSVALCTLSSSVVYSWRDSAATVRQELIKASEN